MAGLRDLGLTYEDAAHGVQSAIAVGGEGPGMLARDCEPKHLRVGVDMSKADMLGLVVLLIGKGIITEEEYVEAVRLSANEELARRQDEAEARWGKPVTFR